VGRLGRRASGWPSEEVVLAFDSIGSTIEPKTYLAKKPLKCGQGACCQLFRFSFLQFKNKNLFGLPRKHTHGLAQLHSHRGIKTPGPTEAFRFCWPNEKPELTITYAPSAALGTQPVSTKPCSACCTENKSESRVSVCARKPPRFISGSRTTNRWAKPPTRKATAPATTTSRHEACIIVYG